MPTNTIYVGRPTKWGNPFAVGRHGTIKRCYELYYQLALGYLCVSVDADTIELQKNTMEAMKDAPLELGGYNLSCWCRPDQSCHADVLLEIANS